MKKVLFLSLLLACFAFVGCQSKENYEKDDNNNIVEEFDIEEIDENDDSEENNMDNKALDQFNALFEGGKTALESDKVNEAIDKLSRALQIKNDADWVYGDLGRAQAKNGDFDGAIASYTKAIELNDERSIYYFWRADAYRAKGQEGLAAEDQKIADDLHSKGMD